MTKAEAAKALKRFTDGFNEANRELDPARNQSFESGALLALDAAVVKASRG
ncbi:hypothetical protein [Streptomyces sp. MST-110588]|uniref:hypothetical protein n=1 Tax=Streptomyces sp. MST-110588 TaxID=2833628 RepID=UPI0032426B28